MSVDLKELRMYDYDLKPDEDIVEAVREGSSEALEYLINKYKNFVRAKARSYFLIGADREDIVQEGMIGLYKSIRDFRGDKLASFKALLNCALLDRLLRRLRQQRVRSIFLLIPMFHWTSLSMMKILIVRCLMSFAVPELQILRSLIINQEEFSGLEDKMGEILSDLERRVLMLYLDGRSYQEIAVDLDRHVKSIDNALQRVKRKLERYLEVRDL